jgi:hypothetical protein
MNGGAGMFRWRSLALFSLAMFAAGCAGYQLGPTNGRTAGAQSIQVNTFANRTQEPRLSEAITSSLRKHLQQDGTYRLDTKNEGDIIVSGAIVDYDRTHVSLKPTDVLTPQDYRITIHAQIIARERITGKIIFEHKVSGHSTLRVGSDLTSSERQTIPLVADDLAKKATSLLVDGSW